MKMKIFKKRNYIFIPILLITALYCWNTIEIEADVLVNRPGRCLGEWENPNNILEQENITLTDGLYFINNSAFTNKKNKEILCSNFSTYNDTELINNNVFLKISWLLTDKKIQDVTEKQNTNTVNQPRDQIKSTGEEIE
ncbi:MAG: hypothetical protein ACI870_000390, partial [Crocinitomicaceae bacterium]